jgi:hypothetical protein
MSNMYNLSMLDDEMQDLINVCKEIDDPNRCYFCKTKRGVEKCCLEKNSNLCETVKRNLGRDWK